MATRRETDNNPDVSGGVETIRDLEASIAPMLLDVDLRVETLRELEPEERDIAMRAIQHASRLHQSTEWTEEQLLERLGCTMSAAQLCDVRLPRLQRCEHFLGLVERLVGCVDTKPDRRAVVLECAKLLRTTGRGSHGLEEAFARGTFSAIDYLELGEISAAGCAVREQAGTERVIPNPYASAPLVHISAPRLGMYLDGRRELLGEARVFDRIGAHIQGCAACRSASEYRRASHQAGFLHG